MNNEKPLVIVLSRNYSTGLGIIRSLGSAGYTVDLIASTKKPGSSIIASCSKYVRNAVEVLSTKIQGDTGTALIDALLKYVGNEDGKIIIFPTDDFTASVVDAHRNVLKEHFLIPDVEESTLDILTLMDKAVQAKLAKAAGLLVPLEWIISLRNEVSIPEDIKYPCFVKPLQSVSGHKTEMAVCQNTVELKNHLSKMQAFYRDREVLVQEYLDIDREYNLSGICLDQKIIVPAVIEKTRIAKYERGVAISGKMIPFDALGEIKDGLIEMLKRFHYLGMFDMDLIRCGDKLYFSEVNLRSGGSNFAYYLNGVNLPEIFVKEITGCGHLPEEEIVDTFGKTFVYEKVAWEDYIHGYMTKKSLVKCIASADFTLLRNVDDPEPGKCFEKRIRLSALKHKVKGILRKEKNTDSTKPDDKVKQNPRVVIVGRNYGNILTMTRALGQAGYDVDILRIYKLKPSRVNLLGQMKPDAHSKYVKQFHECIVNGDTMKVVKTLQEIGKEHQKMLLMPVDDYSACVVDENFDELIHYYIIPNVSNQEGEISRLMDKNRQKQLATSFDLPMLSSVLIRSKDGFFELPEDVPYPCFIKPNVSMKSNKAKMLRCENETELLNVLTKYAKSEDFEILVEEFADIKAEYSILGLSTDKGIIAPGLFRAIASGHKERKGVAVMGELTSCSLLQSMIDECNKFIQSLNYIGLFDVDLIETKNDKVYFVELNFRAGASTHALTEMGVNLPGMLADYLLKDIPVDYDCKLQEAGKLFISEKVLLEEYIRSDVSLVTARQYMENADIYFVKDEQDPAPYQYFRRFYPIAALMRIPYKIRDNRAKKD